MLKKWNDMMRCAFVRSFASFCSSNVLHARSHAKRFVYLFVMLLIQFVFPFFPFLSNNCPCIWIVFTWLFGEPSCGETTLLNSPSEQTNVSYYIRIYKRYIHLHASLNDCVYGMVDMCTSVDVYSLAFESTSQSWSSLLLLLSISQRERDNFNKTSNVDVNVGYHTHIK